MKSELLWLSLPIIGLLSQLGGTFNKLYRRIGIPTTLVILYLIAQTFDFSHFLWLRYIIVWLWAFFCSTLPFTLIGNSIKEHWLNWIWVWVLGLLNGAIVLVLNYKLFYLILIPVLVYGTTITLSNIKVTAKYFQWKFVEFIIYVSVGYIFVLALQF